MVGLLSNVQIANVPKVGRKARRPQHRFVIRHVPWILTPFMCAPVLPGDTMKNVLLQARAVSDPVKNPLIGWWLEYYLYYVPHRAMSDSTALQAMMLDHTASATTVGSVSNDVYRFNGAVDFVGMARDAVVKHHFRDEGESQSPTGSDMGSYVSRINQESWLDSVVNATAFDASLAPDVNVEGSDANTTIQASEIELAMRQYQMLRDMRLTDQTYEDFLRTYGVKIPDQEKEHLPELLRYVREWQYPSNTINSSTGAPVSALSWAVTERADKDRFFREPGVIIGLTNARPKIYLSKQTGAAVGMLKDVFGWLPAILSDDPYSSLRRYATATGPIPGNTDSYLVDVKDLYLYGDQYTNLDHTDATTRAANGMVQLPTAGLNKRYPNLSEVKDLFSTPASAFYVRQDGVCALNILSRVVDTSAAVV